MAFLADILLASGAIVAAFYCMVLSRRLRRFTDLEHGVGSAVTLLATKTNELDQTLRAAQATASHSVTKLEDVSGRAEAAARHLELLVAALHSLPDEQPPSASAANPFRARRPNSSEKIHS
jgi:hypothetical protein